MESFLDILRTGNKSRASDIHLKVGIPPILRVDGRLRYISGDEISPEDTKNLLKNLLTENQYQRLIEIGQVDFVYSVSGIGRYRVNAYQQRGSFCLAMRLVNFEIPTLKKLGLPDVVSKLTTLKQGLIVVTGPTGAGKSTTLASMIQEINETRNEHIITLEDPIEYLFCNKKSIIGQREIGIDTSNFSSALRACLRQDPDIIFVGEMRDVETIEIALTAAETGHLVLSTLHTLGSSKTIDRIIDAFPSDSKNQIRVQVASVLQAVISQQLLPVNSGIGRVPACGVMISTPAIKNLIRENKNYQIKNNIKTGKNIGMILMDDSLIGLYQSGLINKEDAIGYALDREQMIKDLGI